MQGQWIGTYRVTRYGEGLTGPGGGNIVLDIDERRNCYEGVAHLNYGVEGYPFPPMDIWFQTADKNPDTSFASSEVAIFDDGRLVLWDAVKEKYPGFTPAQSISGNLNLRPDSLELAWVTNIGNEGQASLPKPNIDKPSEVPAQIKT